MVKFVLYTGKWPCLCHGVLVLEINEKRRIFGGRLVGSRLDRREEDNPIFWHTGGYCGWDVDDFGQGPWYVNADELPEDLRGMAKEIEKVFNANVPFGCCGGCA